MRGACLMEGQAWRLTATPMSPPYNHHVLPNPMSRNTCALRPPPFAHTVMIRSLGDQLREVFGPRDLDHRIKSATFWGLELDEMGVPLMCPIDGPAVYIAAKAAIPADPAASVSQQGPCAGSMGSGASGAWRPALPCSARSCPMTRRNLPPRSSCTWPSCAVTQG